MGMASIKEGNVTRNFSDVDRLLLKTSVAGTETSVWVPDSQTKLDTLRVSKNGNYTVPDGVYGWKTVYVGTDKSRESITGKKNGQPVVVRRSSNGGGGGGGSSGTSGAETPLITENLPSKIVVTTSPTRTAYSEGETIDYSGIVVTAYNADDTVWTNSKYPDGIVPFEELTFPITIVSASTGVKITCNELNMGPFQNILEIGEQTCGIYAVASGVELYHEYEIGEDAVGIFFSKSSASVGCICASLTKNAVAYKKYRTEEGGERELSDIFYTQTSYTYNNKTVYMYYSMAAFTGGYEIEGDILNVSANIADGLTTANRKKISRNVAWAMLYGDKTASIPVQWQTDYQTDPYEASFDISVT